MTVLLVAGFLLVSLSIAGCSLFEDDPLEAVISGRVTNSADQPVGGVSVRAVFGDTELRQTTLEDGTYAFRFEIGESEELDVTVRVVVDGETSAESVVSVSGDQRSQTGVDFQLTTGENDDPVSPGPSGTISQLVLQNQSGSVLRVIESGGPETVALTFTALDSIGRPLDAQNVTDVAFRLGQSPGNGVSVNPQQAPTNPRGEVRAVVSSGTRSGVIQLVAEATRPDGDIVRSDPVRLTIHGGLPDQDHFSLGPVQRNIPGLVRFNETTEIQVIVGDQYSNPVVPGTAVYFSTTGGLIDGATDTDDAGLGSVTLRSGNPLPRSSGVAVVTAETAGRDEERVSGQTPVIFSGPTQIIVDPGTADFGSYDLTVSDANGNPLAEGTSVSVTVEGQSVEAVGSTEATLDDTGVTISDPNADGLIQPSEVTAVTGPGITSFPFRVVGADTTGGTLTPQVEAIVIQVTSPNGDAELTLFPAGSGFARTAEGDATTDVWVRPDGTVEARATAAVRRR